MSARFLAPCILALPTSKQSASLSVDGSPEAPRVNEPEKKRGAPSIGSAANPNSRLGRKPSPHLQGRVMERLAASPSFVGIDVSKDRLDVNVRPSGQAFAVVRDGKGLDQLVIELRSLAPALIVLEATGGFEITVAAALASAGLPLAVVNPRQIRDFARATGRLSIWQRFPRSGGTLSSANITNAWSIGDVQRRWPSSHACGVSSASSMQSCGPGPHGNARK